MKERSFTGYSVSFKIVPLFVPGSPPPGVLISSITIIPGDIDLCSNPPINNITLHTSKHTSIVIAQHLVVVVVMATVVTKCHLDVISGRD